MNWQMGMMNLFILWFQYFLTKYQKTYLGKEGNKGAEIDQIFPILKKDIHQVISELKKDFHL